MVDLKYSEVDNKRTKQYMSTTIIRIRREYNKVFASRALVTCLSSQNVADRQHLRVELKRRN